MRSKTEVIPDQHSFGGHPAGQHLTREVLWRQTGKLAIERNYEYLVNACFAHESDAIIDRRQQARRSLRRNHAGGVRVERNYRRDCAELSREFHIPAEQLPVTFMNAVEVPDADRAVPGIVRHLGKRPEYPHSGFFSHDNAQTVVCEPYVFRKIALRLNVRQI